MILMIKEGKEAMLHPQDTTFIYFEPNPEGA
jgi:hypothetical protein